MTVCNGIIMISCNFKKRKKKLLISFFSISTTSISNKWILIQSAIAQKTSWLNQFLLNKQEHVDLSSLKLIYRRDIRYKYY